MISLDPAHLHMAVGAILLLVAGILCLAAKKRSK